MVLLDVTTFLSSLEKMYGSARMDGAVTTTMKRCKCCREVRVFACYVGDGSLVSGAGLCTVNKLRCDKREDE